MKASNTAGSHRWKNSALANDERASLLRTVNRHTFHTAIMITYEERHRSRLCMTSTMML